MTGKIKNNWFKLARPIRALFVMLFVILAIAPFFVFHAFAADGSAEGTYIVIGETTYPITDKKTLVTADLELLRNESCGTAGADVVYGIFDGVRVDGTAAVYNKIYDMLLDNATATITSGDQLKAKTVNGQTHIYKIANDITITGYAEVVGDGRLIFVADKAVTITLKTVTASDESRSSGRFNLGYANGGNESCALTFQGRNTLSKVTIRGDYTTTQVTPAFRVLNGGSLYLNYVDLQKFKFGSSETGDAVIYFSNQLPGGSSINAKRCLYMTNSAMHDIQGGKSPGIFLKAYRASPDPSDNSENKKSVLNLYNNEFYNCVTLSGSNYAGGPVIRSFAADNCNLRMESCRLYNNQCKAAGTASGGGAIYWKSAAGKATIIDCEFSGNMSALVGGAIYNTGNMEIENCRFYSNSAASGGGAIAAEPPRTNQYFGNINTNGLTGSLTLDENTILSGNTTNGKGGAIYFNAVVGDNGASLGKDYYIQTYEMTLTIDGATIEGNTANYGGGVAMWLDYGEYRYNTGVVIENGSTIKGNTATADGGAIWMSSNSSCDCKKNVGVTMNGGTLENNTAVNGGAIYIATGKAGVAMNYYIKGGTVKNNTASSNGGAAHIQGGSVIMTGGTVVNCTASANGGAVFIGNGNFSVSAGSITTNKAQQDGGAIYVAGGNATVSGGSIMHNTATQNGGGIAVMDGNYYMYGGAVNNNDALKGNGGGIYVSSTKANAQITILIRSGQITENDAGNSGGALGVRGQDDADFEIIIGINTEHNGTNCHTVDQNTEDCPSIKANTAATSGGGIYLAGSFSAQMNIYCLVEGDNKAAGGVSASNFMKVEGGTLLISSKGEGGQTNHGNVVVNSSIHVTGGRVTLMGRGDNPLFAQPITVNIDASGESYFKDLREKGTSSTYSVQYFENFKINGVLSGQYISIDVLKGTEHTVQAALYAHTGFTINGWTLMESKNEQHVPATPPTVYTAGDKLTLNSDVILYANWVVVGYTIVFEPGVSDYYGEMQEQAFAYNEEKKLSANAFIHVGYAFAYWIDKSTINLPENERITYTNEKAVSGLSNEHGTIITLVAVWNVCQHTDALHFSISSTENSISRQCACLGYTETVTLTDVTGTYDPDKTYPVKIQCDFVSVNQYKPSFWGSVDELAAAVQYTGCKWGNPGEAFIAPISVPENAGKYVATIVLSDKTLTAKVTIYKADQTPPSAPDYEIGTHDETTNRIILQKPNTNTGKVLQYSLWWYDNGELKTNRNDLGEIIWIEWLDTADNNGVLPSWNLKKSYTNYYVEVRYAGTDNYNPSNTVRGIKLFYKDGKVIVKVVGNDGLDVNLKASDTSGLVVDFTPKDTYYLYDVRHLSTEYTIENGVVTGYSITVSVDQAGKTAGINNIPNHTGDSPLVITITFGGAEKKATVVTDTVKNQVFSDITDRGQSNVTISLDSAYTFLFRIENYAHYSDPAVEFNSPLPKGAKIILLDRHDMSYWSYVLSDEVAKIPLGNFKRMGNQMSVYAMNDSETLQSYMLQFIIDFSNCALEPDFTELTARLSATGTRNTVPPLPVSDVSSSKVTLTNRPNFSIVTGETTDILTQTVNYNFASITGIGISKWENLRGIMIVSPKPGITLPPDAHLEVKIANATKIYPLVNNRFIIALSNGAGTAYLKLLSDMMPDAGATYTFDVMLYASDTMVGSTPVTNIPQAGSVDLAYEVARAERYAAYAVMVGTSPICQRSSDGSIVSISQLTFSGKVRELPSGYTVRAALYQQDTEGNYFSTTQTVALTLNNNQFRDVLNLNTMENQLRDNIGSLSLMLRIEIVDPNGKVVYYTPLYFILVDTGQIK